MISNTVRVGKRVTVCVTAIPFLSIISLFSFFAQDFKQEKNLKQNLFAFMW